ncbi:MAG: hypothetical protein ACREM2_12570 [Vulcanimicrobiaceae bacterium]
MRFALALGIVAALALPATARTLTERLEATVTVADSCVVDTNVPLSFGAYDPLVTLTGPSAATTSSLTYDYALAQATGTATGLEQSIAYTGTIPASQLVPEGTYASQVAITLTFTSGTGVRSCGYAALCFRRG